MPAADHRESERNALPPPLPIGQVRTSAENDPPSVYGLVITTHIEAKHWLEWQAPLLTSPSFGSGAIENQTGSQGEPREPGCHPEPNDVD
jgi:hypothetical protein